MNDVIAILVCLAIAAVILAPLFALSDWLAPRLDAWFTRLDNRHRRRY